MHFDANMMRKEQNSQTSCNCPLATVREQVHLSSNAITITGNQLAAAIQLPSLPQPELFLVLNGLFKKL